MPERIILVGHCGVDAPRLEEEVSRIIPSADVVSVNSEQDLEAIVDEGADLLLINRELPFGFDTEEGIDLIRDLRAQHPGVKMMLISDYDEAQEEALEAGAVDGIGKSALGSPEFAETIKRALKGQRAN